MNIKRSSASRGELTKAMSATLLEVRTHHQQIAALLAGMQQLMDGQAALGEAFEALKKRIDVIERWHGRPDWASESARKFADTMDGIADRMVASEAEQGA